MDEQTCKPSKDLSSNMRDQTDAYENAMMTGVMSANPNNSHYFKLYRYLNTDAGQDIFVHKISGDVLKVVFHLSKH